jgi:acyl-CoA thioesterase I
MNLKSTITFFLGMLIFIGCSSSDVIVDQNITPKNYNYLALGDSYTIGQSVCETCRFPIQLQDSIKKYINTNDFFTTQIIAQTGWTTTNLKSAITAENPPSNFDLVTILIGVNNQYQNRPFSLYEQEFPELVNQAIGFAKGNKENVIVVSIPDYAYTPFGNGSASISNGIDLYNTFAENYCLANNITFVNITDITRMGLQQPNLVATDGLHPSEIAYSKFVERILPQAKMKLGL